MMNGRDFVTTMEGMAEDPLELQSMIRTALTKILGELPAMTTLAYTGDAADGDLVGFAQRTQELFGASAPTVLNNIVMFANKRS